MENTRIRGVVFDFGGVLSRWPREDDMQPVLGRIGLSWDALLKGFGLYRLLFDGGKIDCQEMYAKILADNGIAFTPKLLDELYRYDSASWAHPNPETLVWMKDLKTRGYKVGILTNMSDQFATDYFPQAFAAQIALADAVVISARVKLVKPDRPIYDLMATRIGLAPAELLFIDDMTRNVDAARRYGWNGIVLTTVAQARAEADALLAAAR